MKRLKRGQKALIVAALLSIVGLSVYVWQAQPRYELVFLNSPNGSGFFVPVAVCRSETVIGNCVNGSISRVYQVVDGKFDALPAGKYALDSVSAVRERPGANPLIAGTSSEPLKNPYAEVTLPWLYTNGRLTYLPLLSGTIQGIPTGISPNGTMLCGYCSGYKSWIRAQDHFLVHHYFKHACLWQDNRVIDLGVGEASGFRSDAAIYKQRSVLVGNNSMYDITIVSVPSLRETPMFTGLLEAASPNGQWMSGKKATPLYPNAGNGGIDSPTTQQCFIQHVNNSKNINDDLSAINDSGLSVGTTVQSDTDLGAFLLSRGGRKYDLNHCAVSLSGAHLDSATDISATGEIIGQADEYSAFPKAYMLEPLNQLAR